MAWSVLQAGGGGLMLQHSVKTLFFCLVAQRISVGCWDWGMTKSYCIIYNGKILIPNRFMVIKLHHCLVSSWVEKWLHFFLYIFTRKNVWDSFILFNECWLFREWDLGLHLQDTKPHSLPSLAPASRDSLSQPISLINHRHDLTWRQKILELHKKL